MLLEAFRIENLKTMVPLATGSDLGQEPFEV